MPRQPTFRQFLFKHARPRLKALGFEYDPNLEDRAIDYAFTRGLGDDLYASVIFQRHQHDEVPHGYGFTLNIRRYRTDRIGRMLPRDETSIEDRITSFIRSIYGVRLYDHPDYWWEGSKSEMVVANLTDALDKFERYCLPILLDPDYHYSFGHGGPPAGR